jgi:hypothetical protein
MRIYIPTNRTFKYLHPLSFSNNLSFLHGNSCMQRCGISRNDVFNLETALTKSIGTSA